MKTILVSGLDDADREAVRSAFPTGYRTVAAVDLPGFLAEADRLHPDLGFVGLDALLDGGEQLNPTVYFTGVQTRWSAATTGHLIVVTPAGLLREAVKAVKAGASNYLVSPVDLAELQYVAESLREFDAVQHELQYLRSRVWKTETPDLATTVSPRMQAVLDKIGLVAPSSTTVMLTGETGAGKSTLANLIHQTSTRARGPLIVVHCGTVHDNLLESELFGHEKGAFTGAVRRKLGRFEIARGGTIFLDDISVLTATAQIKLLHVIQDRTIHRVGGEQEIPVDVRLITATNVDLKQECEEGRFRWDLFYRLNVFPIEIPPLRERREDIPFLVQGILQRLQQCNPRPIEGLDGEVSLALARYPWPGNVRELENLVERAFILETSTRLTRDSFPLELFAEKTATDGPLFVDTSMPLHEFRQHHLDRLERHYLEALLVEHAGHLGAVARDAGVGLRQLHKLLTRHRLHRRDRQAVST